MAVKIIFIFLCAGLLNPSVQFPTCNSQHKHTKLIWIERNENCRFGPFSLCPRTRVLHFTASMQSTEYSDRDFLKKRDNKQTKKTYLVYKPILICSIAW